MKISNEQIRALQQANEARRNTQAGQKGFDALLNSRLGAEQAQGVAPAMDSLLAPMQGGFPVNLAEALEGTDATASLGLTGASEEMANQMEGMFDSFDQYAAELASNDKSALRKAYSLLEDMTGRIASLRSAFPDMKAQQPELDAMVNELEVLTTTETFKFNRGDYL